MAESVRCRIGVPSPNPNKSDGEYQYMNDLGVIFRCLLADMSGDEIEKCLDRHGYKGSAYRSALKFIRKVADPTAE